MKNKKVIKIIAVVITIILVILNICIYINMKSNFADIITNDNPHENGGLLLDGLFRYGALIWGSLSILIVWIEYFLVNLFMKAYNKFKGIKKIILCTVIAVMLIIMLIIFIRIITVLVFLQ